MKKVFFVLVMYIASFGAAKAGTVGLASQTIKSIETGWSGEGIYIYTDQGDTAGGCSGNGAFLSANQALYKTMLAILLSALQTHEGVSLFVDGCTGSNMKLVAVQINKQ